MLTREYSIRALTLFTEVVLKQAQALRPGVAHVLLGDPTVRADLVDKCGKTMMNLLKVHDGKPPNEVTMKAVDKLVQGIFADLC